jgi:hypothetical protein
MLARWSAANLFDGDGVDPRHLFDGILSVRFDR